MDTRLHRFSAPVSHLPLPAQLPYPFVAATHPLALRAADEAKAYIATQSQWAAELSKGKMLGVLVVRDASGELGYLTAFSGILAGSNDIPYFVPPVFDLLQPNGEFKRGEAEISAINRHIATLEQSHRLHSVTSAIVQAEALRDSEIAAFKATMQQAKARREALRQSGQASPEQAQALIAESQFQKAELKRLKQRHAAAIAALTAERNALTAEIAALKQRRKAMSEALQERIFHLFVVENGRHEHAHLIQVFRDFYAANPTLHASPIPPSGSGECCAPKLLQHAFAHRYTPLCMAEFWWGKSPVSEVRHHGHYYGACLSKCRPILNFMLQGIDVESTPLQQDFNEEIPILFCDEWLVAANKPAGMLSVPGRLHDGSLLTRLSQQLGIALYPVHRLDMDTSGILILAKTKEMQAAMQALFASREVSKRYIALLNGIVVPDSGTIDLPMRPSDTDRPRQVVDHHNGKRAVTLFKVLRRHNGHTRIAFHPHTGRTHQLRLHASHQHGLGCPIVGDRLYGQAASRLMLHAETLSFIHPVTHEKTQITTPPSF